VGRDGFGLRQPPRRESEGPRSAASLATLRRGCATPKSAGHRRRNPTYPSKSVARGPTPCSKQSRLLWRDAPPRAAPTFQWTGLGPFGRAGWGWRKGKKRKAGGGFLGRSPIVYCPHCVTALHNCNKTAGAPAKNVGDLIRLKKDSDGMGNGQKPGVVDPRFPKMKSKALTHPTPQLTPQP
jgi:hypothetical protein